MRQVVAVPIVEPAARLGLTEPMRQGTLREAAGVALRKMGMIPPLLPLLDGYLDARVPAKAVGAIARDLLAEYGFTPGEDVPLTAYDQVLAEAMRKRARLAQRRLAPVSLAAFLAKRKEDPKPKGAKTVSRYTHRFAWGNTPLRAMFKGKPCRIVSTVGRDLVWVEFESGTRMSTRPAALRRRPRRGARKARARA